MTRYAHGFIQKPATGGGFSPDDLSDLELWFDASDSGTITEDGNGVSQWDDKSGNNRDVTQTDNSLKPTTSTINSNDSILFGSGAGNRVLENTSTSFTCSPCTQFAVVTPVNTNSGIRYIINYNITGSSNAGTVRQNGTNYDWIVSVSAGSQGFASITGSLSANTTRAGIGRHQDSTTTVAEDDGANTASDTSVGTLRTPCVEFFVGAQNTSGQNPFQFHIHEIGLYSQRLSDSDKDDLMDYLKTKWGL